MSELMNLTCRTWRPALLAAFMVGVVLSSAGQEVSDRGWIKTNPFGLFVGQFQFGFERPVTDRVSVQLTGGAVRSSLELNTDDLESLLSINTSLNAVDWIGFLAMPEVRYYLSENRGVGHGFYLGAFARARSIQRTMTTNFVGVQHRTAVGAGGVIGGQFTISEHVRGDFFLGPQIKSTTTTFGEHFVYAEEEWLPGVRFGMNFCFQP